MKADMVYKSIFKQKEAVKESKSKKLFQIRESLNLLKRKLREEGEEDIVGESDELNPEGIASIIDKVEDLVVDAINTLGATDPVTSELIDTVSTLEVAEDEAEMMAAIDASAQEAEAIQEDFEPVYDSMGNIVNEVIEDDFVDDEMLLDDGIGYDDFDDEDDLGYYESKKRTAVKVKKFKK